MGQVQKQADEKRATKRDAARDRRAGARRAGGKFQLTLQTWAMLTALNTALIEHDGALRVGLTRDGGALALGVYLGDDYATEYIRPNEGFWSSLLEIAEAWLTDGAHRCEELYAAMGWSAFSFDNEA